MKARSSLWLLSHDGGSITIEYSFTSLGAIWGVTLLHYDADGLAQVQRGRGPTYSSAFSTAERAQVVPFGEWEYPEE